MIDHDRQLGCDVVRCDMLETQAMITWNVSTSDPSNSDAEICSLLFRKGFRAERLWEVAGWQWQLHVRGHVDPRTPNLGEASLRWEVFNRVWASSGIENEEIS